MALEFQSRQPGFGLADKVDRQKPLRQRQLGAAEQRARGQRGLAMARMTLKQRSAQAEEDAMGTAATTRADEAVRPAGAQYGFAACGLGAKGLQELGQ